METPLTRDDIGRIVRAIVDRFRPRRVVLFGSYARGEARADSDLDLMVEMETSQPFVERSVEVGRIFGLRPWPLDLIVYTPDEVERLKKVTGTLVAAVQQEGRVLYERR